MSKKDLYVASLREIDIRLEKGGDLIADLGNIAAVLKKRLNYFWIGTYFVRRDHLVLGPFQGTPACVFLPREKGVCASCARQKRTIIVPDVHRYEGHIACDQHSQSEIVIPLLDNQKRIRGVLDLDHSELNAFDETDQKYLEQLSVRIRSLWREEPLN
ncbi:MAG TPA: GAF domain-containing protein [bacterium]|nr:GAF domain-containing protein [bacterium]